MSEKTSMFELLYERIEKEDIVKLVCNYDNKFNELEEENKQLQNQLQQKENIIKEVREEVRIYEEQSKDGITNELDNYVFVQRLKKVLDKEVK